jgi:hypothetical protein
MMARIAEILWNGKIADAKTSIKIFQFNLKKRFSLNKGNLSFHFQGEILRFHAIMLRVELDT